MSAGNAQVPVYNFLPRASHPIKLEAQSLHPGHLVHKVQAHVHQFFELLFVESGSGVHQLSDRISPVRDGDLIAIGPGELHDGRGLHIEQGWMLLFEAEALGACSDRDLKTLASSPQ